MSLNIEYLNLMKNNNRFIDVIASGNLYLKNVSIDDVIFGYHDKELKILLQQPQNTNKWALAGGYIKRTESIEDAARRIARERTGLTDLFLKQFMAFGNPARTANMDKALEIAGSHMENWTLDYFVTIGFYTLTEFEKVKPSGEYYIEECRWWDIHNLPAMIYDHREIIDYALKALRLHIYHYPIGYKLLSEKFTIPEIHVLYETILGKNLDVRNFAKKLLSTGIIKKTGEQRNIGPHRTPFLYVFDKLKYENALKEGMALFI
jgi:ADP-ribose pyrophosphatase YjhB (NUDIX family)